MKQSNPALSKEVKINLGKPKEDYYWTVMINDAQNQLYDYVHISSDNVFWTDYIKVENFAGKNIIALGVCPPEFDECIPGYNPVSHFDNLITNALNTDNDISPSNITDILWNEGCPPFNLKPLMSISVHDKDAGLDLALDYDCTFANLLAGKYKDWKVALFSVIQHDYLNKYWFP